MTNVAHRHRRRSAQIVSSARNIQTQVVGIDVDGHRVAQALAYPTWQTLEMLIEGNFVVDGTNEIVITWPVEVDSSEAQLGRAADALGARRLPYFYRVYGEIHALSVFDPSRVARAAEVAVVGAAFP